jgi:hypothetical protein
MENKIIAIRDYNNFLGLFSLQKITLPVGAQLSSFESRYHPWGAGLDFLKTHNIRYSIYDKEAIYQ